MRDRSVICLLSLSYSKQKTLHADRGNYVTSWECKVSQSSSDSRTLLAGKFQTPIPPIQSRSCPDQFSSFNSQLCLFRWVKHHLCGNHYIDNEDVETTVPSWLSEQASSFYEEGIQNLVAKYNKCLNKLVNALKNEETYVEYENEFGF